ncbi:hypothetical protein METBIDRAFT_76750 [Metschnikowia bicuspidata var. bicuspidata NRRL YB-4993]|uniref:Uncharacterized protein n=1 Tax=Metschnikowia bicuspidata var. bicuspidata NRRL YB-4993 TaxID=869754 RepID=A0A1A0HII0_9ASCO|nr:hypothetical protein METBIDRAFT_76750 [Metschnikowia bicuspidata var. bicuspidata NRRL YB-4993]OBA23806.1 hypothetical protein METBIDRAFT_76750 [Metschnikowia bicuspidata var. bicuspidata NRRL YB-4993]
MRVSTVSLGKRTLKHGGKSGILPDVRPIFRHNPIRPKTAHEIEEESRIEQGFAEGVPLPKKKGFKFSRMPVEKPVLTVKERIERIDKVHVLAVPDGKQTKEQLWAKQREQLRKQYLKEAYETESKRIEKLEAMQTKKRELDAQEKESKQHKESETAQYTLPTIDSYLSGPIMRPRTPEEQAIVDEKRMLNRKLSELEVMNAKATDLLELYHAAANYITTEEELELAIKDAFELEVGRFESSARLIEDKVSGYANPYVNSKNKEQYIKDVAFGQINGQPGLDMVKDTLSGEAELIRREAQRKLNHN